MECQGGKERTHIEKKEAVSINETASACIDEQQALLATSLIMFEVIISG
jgi:hypothetical protein